MLTGMAGLLVPRLRCGWPRRSWLLVTGEPRRPGLTDGEQDAGAGDQHGRWTAPAGFDPQAPDADVPTLLGVWAGDGGAVTGGQPDRRSGEPVT